MTHELTNCPRCNSDQGFNRRTREIGRGVWEAFIKCGMCRWEQSLGYTTPVLETNRRQLASLHAKAAAEVDRLGVVQGNTQRMLQRVNQRYNDLARELRSRVDGEVAHS